MIEKKRTTKKRVSKKATASTKKAVRKTTAKTKVKTTVTKKTRLKAKKSNIKHTRKRVSKLTDTNKQSAGFDFTALYDSSISSEAQLCYFQTPDHIGMYERDIDVDIFSEYESQAPNPSVVDQVCADTSVSAVDTEKSSVALPVNINKQAHSQAVHVLDLTGSLTTADVQQSQSIKSDSQMQTLWNSISQQEDEVVSKQFTELTVVTWFGYLYRLFCSIAGSPLRLLVSAFQFIRSSFIEYVKNVGVFIRLALHGKLNPESLLDPDTAFVDVSFFEKNYTKQRLSPLQLAPNAIAIKSLVLFLILSSVLVLPVKGMAVLDSFKQEQATVLGASETAYASLQQALTDIQQFSWLTASDHFEDSEKQFTELYSSLQDSPYLQNALLKYIPSAQKRIQTAEHLAQVGIEVSDLGQQITILLDMLNTSDDSITLTTKIRLIQQTIDRIHAIEDRIDEHFTYIDVAVLPDDIATNVRLLQDILPHVAVSLDQIDGILDFAYILLGGDKQQRYVLVFQNSDELRPAGGFMGSLTAATIYQGKIINHHTPGGGPYDWQGWLSDTTRAPKPLWLVNPIWQFQDANWFVDFPTSAEKVLSFYTQIEPEQVDGVIAINSYVLPDIIDLLGGEVVLPEYNKTLTSENVLYELQLAVEVEYDREENKPKKIIGDLFTILTEKLVHDNSIELIDLLDVVNDHLLNRDIQMYFKNPVLQDQAKAWQWSGQVIEAPGDYLMIVHANIGGAKTDKYITEHSTLTSVLSDSDNPTNTLTITRTNNGIVGDVFYGHNNVSYVQVYVPKGSELLRAYGDFEKPQEKYFELPPLDVPTDAVVGQQEATRVSFTDQVEVFEVFGKTVFGFWMQTNVGETTNVTFEYTVPIKPISLSDKSSNQLIQKIDSVLQATGVIEPPTNGLWHSFYWQRQSGNYNHTIEYRLQYPNTWELEHALRPGFVADGAIMYEGLLENDISAGFLFRH